MKKSDDKSNINMHYQRNMIKATVATNIGINNHDRLVKAYGENADRAEVLNKLKKQSRFTLGWYIIFGILGIVCLILDPSSWFNILDLFIVMLNIDLVARGKLVGIYVGILECFFYAFIAYKSQLYGEIIKTLLICAPLNAYSIISWTISMKRQKQDKYIDSEKKDEEDIIIKKLPKKMYAVYIPLLIVLFGACYCLLRFALGQTTALILGSLTLALMIIGKIFTAQRYMESYMVFNINDGIALAMWIQTLVTTGFSIATLTMIIYELACFTMDIYAYGLWKGMYRKVAVNGGVILNMREVNIKRITKLKRRYKNLTWNKDVDINKNS